MIVCRYRTYTARPSKFSYLSEIQNVLLWKAKLLAMSDRKEHPTVSDQCQVLKKQASTELVPLQQ